MAINSRAVAVGGGALLGAYTSDITDNPLTGLVSTAITAGIGGMMVLPEHDMRRMADVVTSVQQNSTSITDRATSGITRQNEELRSKFLTRLKTFSDLNQKITKQQGIFSSAAEESLYKGYKANTSHIKDLMKYNMMNISDFGSNPHEFVKTLQQLDDSKIIKQLMPLLSGDDLSTVNLFDVKAPRVTQEETTIKGKTAAEKINQLSDIFHKKMGNSIEEATEKATLLVNRSEGMIQVKDGSVILNDINDNGRQVTVPITGYDSNDVRYHNAGNGKATSVKGFTPYALDYAHNRSVVENGIERKINLSELKRGMAPEMMLKYLGEDAPISKILPNINSLFQYDSREVGSELFNNNGFTAQSASFINNSNQVDYSNVRNVDLTGNLNTKNPLRKIKRVSDKPDTRVSEEVFVRSMLGEGDPNSAKSSLGVSNNLTTTLQGGDMNTISMFPPMERNVSGSVLRDTVPMAKTMGTNALHQVFGETGSHQMYASAQVMNKLDINDAKSFNQLSQLITGDSSKVLGDGFGLFNQAHDRVLGNSTMSDIVIPRGNGTLVKDKGLLAALESGNVSQYIRDNGNIKIGNDVLGYDKYGSEIKLGNQYSSGSIETAFINKNNDLVLRAKAVFNPKEENLVKIFSVGSKALATGVEESNFNLLTGIGSLMNEGRASFTNNILTFHDQALAKEYGSNLDGQQIKALAKNPNFMKNHGSRSVTLITDASRTGMSDLNKFITGSKLEANEQKLLESSGINKLIKDTGKRASSVITGYLTLETKAAEDLTAHLTSRLLKPLQDLERGTGNHLTSKQLENYAKAGLLDPNFATEYKAGNKQSQAALLQKAMNNLSSAFRSTLDSTKFINKSTREAAMNNLFRMVDASGIANDIQSGFSSTVGSTHRGASMVGAGNEARMSWNANMQLRQSGFTKEQLNWFGKIDEGTLYELEGFTGENSRNAKAVNQMVRGREKDLESILSNDIPETRLARIGAAIDGFDLKSDYISYNLNYDGASIKSLNFGVISTNRGGKYDFKDTEIIKQLDKYRLDIMSLDISLDSAEKSRRKAIEAQLKETITEYETFKKSAFSGDNNILKNALSLYSDQSSINIAQPIGGDAKTLIEGIERDASGKYKDIANNMFVSSEGMNEMARKMGIQAKDIVQESIVGTNLKTIGYKDIDGKFVPFSALVTREPAQGTLSSEFMELILDPSIQGGKNSIYAVQDQFGWAVGKSGDFDQDTTQTLYSKLDRDQYESMRDQAKKVRDAEKPYLNQQKNMTPKGAGKVASALSDFDSPKELNSYMLTADYKGKVRKIFSPTATTMALNYMKAIDLDVGGDTSKLTLGRIATYKSIENLLKSSHLDTKNFLDGTQSIEKLQAAREAYITSGDVGKYKGALQTHLPSVLGFGGGDLDTDKTINQAVDIITEAELNHSKTVSRMAFSPLDMNTQRGVKGFEQTLYSIMDSMDMFDLNKGVDLKRSPAQLYNNLNDAIVGAVKKNKGLLMAGGAALVGVNLLGRSEPSFSDSRANMRQHSSKMLQTPMDPESVQTGIETNKTKSNFIQPNSYNNSKSVQVQGDFIDQGYNSYNQFDSSLSQGIDPSRSISSAIYGGNIRSARLELSDL